MWNGMQRNAALNDDDGIEVIREAEDEDEEQLDEDGNPINNKDGANKKKKQFIKINNKHGGEVGEKTLE